jgi:flap endonuclease-1
MGIRNLNRYLRQNCPNSIHQLQLNELSGKRIAIDISIYLYKYETENALIENMYNMISIFKYYNIIPIFIFDGKPPPEKKDLLLKRKMNRIESKEEYNKLKLRLEENDTLDQNNTDSRQDMLVTLEKLKRQFIQIDKSKIEKIKDLIRAYGETYYDAPGEADELCASLVINKKVWACLSEDMDLFVYGCKRVLRYFSIIGHSVVLYNLKCILMELNMTQKEFKEICILSGSDYNIKSNTDNSNLSITINYFKNYKSENTDKCFYDWVLQNSNYITNVELLNKIFKIFDLTTDHTILEKFKNIRIASGPVIQKEVEKIMKEYDFIFIN